MPTRELRIFGDSAYVNIPKGELKSDGLIDVETGQIRDDVTVRIDRLDDGAYAIRLAPHRQTFSELAETDFVQREIAVALRDVYENQPAAPTAD